ncbi:HAD superfamily hydrolase (TIGR01509 family)/HAD superfamily hydrolase (TIGR01549 family) [Azomonas agilis]|uniref:HAD superfamily hydrolase (TIGR01509 family)/HAD superfamily hydrolase (TIGR01549 family) n=1 Tax=Azomonas agilis TaxID=116849 RepID=A0A562IZI2_9GAMM|nr:HAD family hydrolase [Azomonas agilis]TWH76250.1 HAD superfamily hydrolase (TIGR01509 family)/HAD superfamily hydrolase (TIGR01549 family) [Azomonas agilis]
MIRGIHHWVFDMDGTLTLAVHDFAAIRRALEIPPQDDILDHLAALPAQQAAVKRAWLLEHERALAQSAQAAPGACELVKALHDSGYTLGILTRNARELALITLEVLGIHTYFAEQDILGRDEAPPKPRPDGLLHLAQGWNIAPSQLLMVGDYLNDVQCARMAGAYNVLVNVSENLWPEWTDLHLADCHALHQYWQERAY